METLTIDNPIKIPGLLSFLTYRRFDAETKIKIVDRQS